jgi:hypothetical protein
MVLWAHVFRASLPPESSSKSCIEHRAKGIVSKIPNHKFPTYRRQANPCRERFETVPYPKYQSKMTKTILFSISNLDHWNLFVIWGLPCTVLGAGLVIWCFRMAMAHALCPLPIFGDGVEIPIRTFYNSSDGKT